MTKNAWRKPSRASSRRFESALSPQLTIRYCSSDSVSPRELLRLRSLVGRVLRGVRGLRLGRLLLLRALGGGVGTGLAARRSSLGHDGVFLDVLRLRRQRGCWNAQEKNQTDQQVAFHDCVSFR